VTRPLLVVFLPMLVAHPGVVVSQGLYGSTGSFEESPCPFELRGDTGGIRCGYVTVPEDWYTPDSRRIRIAVAVLRARANDAAADPILRVRGGPMPTLVDAPAFARSALRADRDLILFDHRGIGHSDAICPDLGRGYVRALGMPLSTDESLHELRRLAGECRAWAMERGVDLGAYRSRNMARDVIAVARALGYDSWHLLADSYGTHIAFSVMRLHPAGLRSVAMMGLVPPHVERIETNGLSRSLDLMARYCADEPACAAVFPDPRAEYEALHARLEQEPLTMRVSRSELFPDGTFTLGGRSLQRFVLQLLYSRSTLAALPMLVRETARGNTAPLAAFVDQVGPFGAMISGTTWAAWCSDLGAWAENYQVPERPAADDDNFRAELASLCPALGVRPSPAGERQPFRTDLPVLLLAGEHDATTPPEYAYAAAEWLPRHHLVEYPGRGHEFVLCDVPTLTAFFDDPTVGPDPACAAGLARVPFVTSVRVTRGIPRMASRAMGGAAAPVLAALGLPLAVMLSGAVGWPAAALVRRLRRRERPAGARLDRWARLGAGAIALLALAFVVLLGWTVVQTIGDNPFMLLIGLPSSAAPLFLMPWVLLAGSIALVVVATSAWQRAAWTPWARIHFTLVAAASVAFTIAVFLWGLI
jgi:pimeloyl-ACP methyl ester carboxylesterase